jgi:hypothetical protein
MAVVAPVTPQALESVVAKFIGDARTKAVGGLTVAEFGSLTIGLLRLTVTGLESIPTDKAEKKAWAIQAVAVLFDAVADSCVPTLAWPAWLILRPAIRSLVLAAAGGALEQVLSLIRDASSPAAVITIPPEPPK